MLRGHVGKRPADEGESRPEAGLGVGGEVEVEQDRLAVVGEEDVGRLEVAVEDAPLVGMSQALRDPLHEPEDGRDIAERPQSLRAAGEMDRVGG